MVEFADLVGRRRHRWAAVVAASIVMTGCSGIAGPAPTVSRQADISQAKSVPPAPDVPATWVLTGVPVEGDPATRPALAVKIENSSQARPQTGLDQADVVWEEMVEGGVTRFVAVFHSRVPDEVGPVRSVRPMDPAIIGPYRGILAFSGGQTQYVNALSQTGLQLFSHDAGADGFFRKKGRTAPHNVFGDPATWWDGADSGHADNPPEQFFFARTAAQASAVVAGTPAAQISLSMSGYAKPAWAWDTVSGTWLRSEGSTPAVCSDGSRIAVTNVVVLMVDVHDTSGRDPAGNPIPDTDLSGSGEALVATGGQTISATWSKASDLDPVVLTTGDGARVTLAPGSTWVELMPNGRSLTIS